MKIYKLKKLLAKYKQKRIKDHQYQKLVKMIFQQMKNKMMKTRILFKIKISNNGQINIIILSKTMK